MFEVLSLDYLATFPKPHFLGVQVAACTDPTHLTDHPEDARYPDCVAVQLDESNQKVSQSSVLSNQLQHVIEDF